MAPYCRLEVQRRDGANYNHQVRNIQDTVQLEIMYYPLKAPVSDNSEVYLLANLRGSLTVPSRHRLMTVGL